MNLVWNSAAALLLITGGLLGLTLPFGKTFWSDAFGIVTDRFGTPWMVSVEAPPS